MKIGWVDEAAFDLIHTQFLYKHFPHSEWKIYEHFGLTEYKIFSFEIYAGN